MRDQAPLVVDHVSLPVLANLDLRNHVPNELEVDLGNTHAGVSSDPGECERHVRLRFAAEIDWTEVDLLGHRVGEFRFMGKIDMTADHVHGELGLIGSHIDFSHEAKFADAVAKKVY